MDPRKRKDIEREISVLQGRKESRFLRIQRLYDMIERLQDPTVRKHFDALIGNVDKTVSEFEEVVNRLNDLNLQIDENYTVDYQALDSLEDMVCFIRRAAQEFRTEVVDKGSGDSVPLAQLPKIELPTFSGDPLTWPVFYDTFSSLIHHNSRLDDIAKLYYLMGCLKGRALEVCSGVNPTAANYSIIWENLTKKYQNPRLLADRYLQRMLDFRPLTSESADGLNSLSEHFVTSYQSLKQLGIPDLADFITASLALSKLDPSSRRAFEMSNYTNIPTLEEVTSFIQRQAAALGRLRPAVPSKRVAASWLPSFAASGKPAAKPAHTLVASQVMPTKMPSAQRSRPCPICRGPHQVYLCDAFAKASIDARWQLVKKHNLCFNCLSDVHLLSACKSLSVCRICRKRHHSTLHPDSNVETTKISGTTSAGKGAPEPEVQNLVAVQPPLKSGKSVVVLPTAVVKVVSPTGESAVRFLVDSGSQAHLISLKCCRRLGLPMQKGPLTLGGIGSVSEPVRGKVNFVVTARLDRKVQFDIEALVLQRITSSMPPIKLCVSECDKFNNIPLADPTFDRPGEIEGVLGAALFAQIIKPDPPLQFSEGPSAIATQLGYVIMGTASAEMPSLPTPLRTFCTFEEPSLDQVFREFLEREEAESPKQLPPSDECEKQFVESTTRTEEGRYVVQLPFTEFPPDLGDSYTLARNRLISLEKHLQRSPDILLKYQGSMRDYLVQGHISLAPSQEPDSGFFIPHFPVFKESSSTPVRIVFDASSKSANGKSLNDVLMTGPKLQTDIHNILLRFRVHPVAVVADIRQMFRNILVSPHHRPFQKLLWRFNPGDPIQTYELNCVPFGLKCAPFLALRTVKQLAEDEKPKFPLAARIANLDMYVDDIVTSVAENEALEVVPQLLGLFRAGGFTLAKWTTNSERVAQLLPEEEKQEEPKDFDKGDVLFSGIKVLGLNWDAQADKFFFKYNLREGPGTKRHILSTIARIWDPLGFLAPVTLLCKQLLKKLWICKSGWDDPPPEAIAQSWERIFLELPHLTKLSISRYPGISQHSASHLVGFADSSEMGFGAAIYVITQQKKSSILSTLLVAKSRIAPMKFRSIPRLELCAALLLAKLFRLVLSAFPHFLPAQCFALSDSEDVLHWLSKPPHQWKTYVANRVSKIQEIIHPDRWFHVPGKENIADLISRGATPLQLLNHPGWIHGPPWLILKPQDWPIRKATPNSRPPLESKSLVTVVTEPGSRQPIQELIERSSSWNRLRRTLVYVLRFGGRLAKRPNVSAEDLELAERRLVRVVQHQHFAQEFALLSQKKPPSSTLRFLNPFLYEGCIRVGGRLEHADLTFAQKHPLLLPKRCHLVDLIVDYYHIFYLHAGPNLLLSLLRQKFWILSARSIVRKRIHGCNRCFRLNPKNSPPLMGSLPPPRVSEAKPFVSSGVDYAGPFRVTIGRYRGVKTQKAYVCMFVCLSVKAVHLELAPDLSTPAFLNCFKRFIARRGPVSTMYSDCGTNFVGAKAKLEEHYALIRRENYKAELGDLLASHSIKWKFNPPSAPHFGGLWEANVKSMKSHLFRVIGTQILSWEEFSTLLTQIESLLNSRPLCVLSSDPGEPEALTPAHFLNLTPLRSLPFLETDDPSTPLKARKSLIDRMILEYWRRWRLEYLVSLQPRKRWTEKTNPLTVGSVVVVREENSPPLHWPLGVIEEIHPGADGVVRVATVRVRKTVLKRPVVKLFPLPTQ